jgi:hypothetical protein
MTPPHCSTYGVHQATTKGLPFPHTRTQRGRAHHSQGIALHENLIHGHPRHHPMAYPSFLIAPDKLPPHLPTPSPSRLLSIYMHRPFRNSAKTHGTPTAAIGQPRLLPPKTTVPPTCTSGVSQLPIFLLNQHNISP